MQTIDFLIFCDYKEECGFIVDRDFHTQEYKFVNKSKEQFFTGDGINGNGSGNGDGVAYGYGFGFGTGYGWLINLSGDGCGNGDYVESYDSETKNIMEKGCGDY